METDEKQVSLNIKSCRVKRNITQKDISNLLGISKRTYIIMENHPFRYNIYKLQDVAKIIGCNINEFFLPINLTNSERDVNVGK